VDADRIADRPGLAEVVGDGGVQVGDLAQAIAAELERVGPFADEVLTGVEVGLPVPEPGIAVGHDHFRNGGSVHHGPFPLGVPQADLVQGQPLACVEADSH